MNSCLPTSINLKFYNSTTHKQSAFFIKILRYAYSYSLKYQHQIYLYICNRYLCFTNDFYVHRMNYHSFVAFLSPEQFSFINGSEKDFSGFEQYDGYLYRIDVREIYRFLLRLQIKEIHLYVSLPQEDLQDELEGNGKICVYGPEGTESDMRIQLSIINYKKFFMKEWPFKSGRITNDSTVFFGGVSCHLIKINSKLKKDLEYLNKHTDFWLQISPQGITLKIKENGKFIIEHELVCYSSPESFKKIKLCLNDKTHILVKTRQFLHHLKFIQNTFEDCLVEIVRERESDRVYLLMRTIDEGYFGVSEFFEVHAGQVIEQKCHWIEQKKVKSKQMMIKSHQKSINLEEQTIILNRYYGIEYEESLNLQLALSLGELSATTLGSTKSFKSRPKTELD